MRVAHKYCLIVIVQLMLASCPLILHLACGRANRPKLQHLRNWVGAACLHSQLPVCLCWHRQLFGRHRYHRHHGRQRQQQPIQQLHVLLPAGIRLQELLHELHVRILWRCVLEAVPWDEQWGRLFWAWHVLIGTPGQRLVQLSKGLRRELQRRNLFFWIL